MAQNFVPSITDHDYRNFLGQVIAETYSQAVANAVGPDGVANLMASWDLQGWLKGVVNQLIYGNNLYEADRGQLYDIATFLENIELHVANLGGVDLSVITANLQSLNSNVSTIMGAVAGGSDVGFGEVVNAIAAENFTAQQFLQNFDAHLRVLESQLSQVVAAGASDDLSKAILEVGTYTAKQQDTQNLVTNAFAQADLHTQQKIADNTLSAAQLNAAVSLLANMSQPDSDDYSDWLVTSGLMSKILPLGAKLAKGIAKPLGTQAAAVGAILGLEELDQTFNDGRVTTQVMDNSLWAIGHGAEFIGKLANKILDIGEQMKKSVLPTLEKFLSKEFGALTSGLQEFTGQQPEVLPTTGFNTARRYLVKAAELGMHAHHTAELLEMIPFVKHLGLNQLSAFMSDMAGFAPIAEQTWGKSIGEGVGRAAGYEINALMRSRLPDERLLDEALIRRKMNIGEYKVLNAFNGYNDGYIDLKADVAWRRPTLREILQLVQDSSVTEEDLTFFLRDAGHRDEFIQKILPIVLHKRAQAKEQALLSEVIANLREGFISEEDAQIYFDHAALTQEERDVVLLTARLAFRRGRVADNLATLQNEYTLNLMDATEFQLAARAQGISEARIAGELAAIEVKRNGAAAHQETADAKAEVRKQQSLVLQEFRVMFQHGMASAAEFEQALIQSGILPATARLTVELEQVKLEGRAGAAKSAAAARLTAQEIKLRQDTFVEMFRKGIISNLQLESALRQLGLSDGIVIATVNKEMAARILTAADLLKTPAALKAKELFTLAKSTLQVQFAKGAIGADDYLQQLVLLGVDETVARATVSLEVAKRGAEKQPPKAAAKDSTALNAIKAQVAALEDQATAGKISADDFSAALDRIGLLEETVNALLAQLDEEQAAAAAANTAGS